MSASYRDGVRMWPLGQARMVSSLDADDAPAGEVSLWLDTSDPERPRAGIEVEIDLGALGTTTLHIPVPPRVIGGAARVILAPTYQAGERVVDLASYDGARMGVVVETADAAGMVTLRALDAYSQSEEEISRSAEDIARPRTLSPEDLR